MTCGINVATINIGMRRLSRDKRTAILRCLVEGNSVNSTARMAGVSKLTVLRLLADVGKLCAHLHDSMVRDLSSARVQVDEIWTFVGCKEKTKRKGGQGDGDCWTWIALDADSKLVISYLVGLRDSGHAYEIMRDVANRLRSRVQLTTDGFRAYLEAVGEAFGGDIDYAMLVKLYGKPPGPKDYGRYSPSEVTGRKRSVIQGNPDRRYISTSFVERQNLTMRMQMRRFTRLTNAFSKRWVNHEHAIALHYFVYNFCRKHQTLGTAPAIKAGITNRMWNLEDLVIRLETEEKQRVGHTRINRVDRT